MNEPGSRESAERILGARVQEFTRFREAIRNSEKAASGLKAINALFSTLYPTGGEPITARLPEAAFLRMEAQTSAFLADYVPKLEREVNKGGPIRDAELLRELVAHQFNLVARECMAVCSSGQEFEAQLRWDIAWFVCCGLSQYGWVTDGMAEELDAGFTLFMIGAKPWATDRQADRDGVPLLSGRYAEFAAVSDRTGLQVGAIAAEVLSHLALRLRAEAWKRVAESGGSKPAQADAAESSADESAPLDAGPTVERKDGCGPEPEPQFRGGPDRKTTLHVPGAAAGETPVDYQAAQAKQPGGTTPEGNMCDAEAKLAHDQQDPAAADHATVISGESQAAPAVAAADSQPKKSPNCKDEEKASQRQKFMAPFLVKQTLSGVATKSGVNHSSLHRWYRGNSQLHLENLSMLAEYLKVALDRIPN